MKIRKLLAAALVLIMVFAAIPVLSLAEGVRTVTYEAKQMSKLDRVWAQLDAAEEKALLSASSRDKKQEIISAVYEAALGIKEVDKDSFDNFCKDGFSFTVDGMYNAYNYRLRHEINRIENPAPQPEGIIVEDYSNGKPVDTKAPNSPNVLLVAPYYGIDGSFTNQYKTEAQSIANATGGTYTLIQTANATGPAIAQNYTNKGVVIYDSHGVQQGTSSYLCLTTNSGITSNDYNNGWAVRSGDEAFIDGRYIENHVNGNLGNCFVWMAICEGMKRGGQGTTGSALLRAGAAAVYGYSQSVSFRGDYLYEASFWGEMKQGKTVAQAIQTMKNTVGVSDPYTNPTAWPILMSATDAFPANPDGRQNVTCNWTLLGGGGGGGNAIQSVTLNSVNVAVGSTQRATLTVTPSNASYTTTWSTYNSSIATVDTSGYVRGVSAGTTTLSATVRDNTTGQSYNRTATITVTGGTTPTAAPGTSYERVYSIENGGRYIIVAENSVSGSTGYAVGNSTVSGGRYLNPVAISVSSSSASVSSNADAITWVASGNSSSGYTFRNVANNKYMGLDSAQYLYPSNSGVAWKYTGSSALDNQIDTDGYYYLSYSSGKYTTSKNSGSVRIYKVASGTVNPTPTPTYAPNPTPTYAPNPTPTYAPNPGVTYERAYSIENGGRYILVAENSVSGSTGYAVGNSTVSGGRYLNPVAISVSSSSASVSSNADAITWVASGNSSSGYTFRNVANNKYMGLDSAQYLYPSNSGVAWKYTGSGALDNQIDTDGYYYLSYGSGKYTTSKNAGAVRLYKVSGGTVNPTPTYAPNPTPTYAPNPGSVRYERVYTITSGAKYVIVADSSVYGTTGYAVGNNVVSNNRYLNTVSVTVNSNSTLTVTSGANAITWIAEGNSTSGYSFRNVANNKYMGLDSAQFLCPSNTPVAWKFTSSYGLDNQVDTDGYFFLSYSTGRYTTSKTSDQIRLYRVIEG